MNKTDLFCCTVTQMIDPARLAAFTSTVVSDGPIVAAPILTKARHDHVLTPRYELTPTNSGVTGRTESGESSMSWTAIATLLAEVVTPERARALSNAVPVGGNEKSTDRESLDTLRAGYAHAAATAGGLIDPPLRHESDNGFDIELRSTTHRTTVAINQVELFDVRPHQLTCNVDVRPHTDPTKQRQVNGFDETVLFVPRGESNAPRAGSVGTRVGIERLDPDSEVGAQWALQIDHYDTIIIEAFPHNGVRIAVYDNDPKHENIRFEKQFPIPPLPSPTERRFASLKIPQAGREL